MLPLLGSCHAARAKPWRDSPGRCRAAERAGYGAQSSQELPSATRAAASDDWARLSQVPVFGILLVEDVVRREGEARRDSPAGRPQ